MHCIFNLYCICNNECNLKPLQVAAVQGDGYKGNKSPHTDFERFEGVSLGRAALVRMEYSKVMLNWLIFLDYKGALCLSNTPHATNCS